MFATSWRRPLAALALVGVLPLAGGCFGSFNMTRKIYTVNKGISPDKWLRWLAFLAFNVIPIYPFSVAVDVFFANAWEFWGGTNPITAKLEPQTLVGPNGEVASLVPVENGARIVITEPSGVVHSATLLREEPGTVAAYDAEGRFVARVTGLDTSTPHLAN
jgi:hypothetical protein